MSMHSEVAVNNTQCQRPTWRPSASIDMQSISPFSVGVHLDVLLHTDCLLNSVSLNRGEGGEVRS